MAERSSIQGRPEVTNATVGKESPARQQEFWTAEIARGCDYFKDWWDTCDRIYERYRDERGRNDGTGHRTSEGGRLQLKRLNILWSNVQTLFPALYTTPPEPIVSRRYKDEDPLARLAVEINERCLQFIEDPDLDEHCYDSAMRCAVLDYLLVGRGISWQRYERESEERVEQVEVEDEEGETVIEETTLGSEVTQENVFHDHVRYRDFLHMISPTWDEILRRGWVARLHYMTRTEVREEFGEEAAKKIQLTASDTAPTSGRISRTGNEKKGKEPCYAQVWEVWNVPDRKVYFTSEGMSEPLEVRDDPLRLRGFLPCARPLYATTTPDTLIPVPDYVEYYDQAENLDRITDKKWKLTTALRVAGFYAGQEAQSIQQVFDGTDRNVMISVQDWAHIQDKGGISGLIEWVPLDLIMATLRSLEEQENDNKQNIFEITGIADIIRGQSKASETLGAQRLKGQWASVRLADRQRLVSKYCRDTLRIDGEIICEHYDPKTIAEMTNFANSQWAQRPEYAQAFDEAVALLKDDKQRTFRIDVETEDTVFADQMQERQQNVEMLTGLGQFMSAAAEIGAVLPESVPVLGEMIKIGLSSFSGSKARQLETYVDEMVAKLTDRVQKQMENPQPSPEQIEAQQKQQEGQTKAQIEMAKVQTEQQGQVLDFRTKNRDQALEKRKQDMEFVSAEKDRIAQLLAKAASGSSDRA